MGNKDTVGTIVENAYTDFAKMVIVESGTQKVGMWIDEAEYLRRLQKGICEEPLMINGVMSNTDNTQEQMTAYYGDIIFLKSILLRQKAPLERARINCESGLRSFSEGGAAG